PCLRHFAARPQGATAAAGFPLGQSFVKQLGVGRVRGTVGDVNPPSVRRVGVNTPASTVRRRQPGQTTAMRTTTAAASRSRLHVFLFTVFYAAASILMFVALTQPAAADS